MNGTSNNGDDSTRAILSSTSSYFVPSAPPFRARLAFAITVGVLAAAYVLALAHFNTDFVSDFDQIWAGARFLLDGEDPYRKVGLRGAFLWKWPLYYPVPALLVVSPLASLSVVWARAVFVGLGTGLLAFGITRDGWHRWPIFICIPFLISVELAQWAPLYTAAFFLPWVGVFAIAKPNVGLALAAAARTNRALAWIIGGSLVLVAASFIVSPGWIPDWLERVRSAQHFRAPVTRPLGFLLLLALLKWRRNDARFLLVFSCVPTAPSLYDPLMLFIVCESYKESLALTASTGVLFIVLFFLIGLQVPAPTYKAWGAVTGNWTVVCCYLTALAIVLRKPNTGEFPAWITRFLPAVRRIDPSPRPQLHR